MSHAIRCRSPLFNVYTLSLLGALPITAQARAAFDLSFDQGRFSDRAGGFPPLRRHARRGQAGASAETGWRRDRKSTRLNSSHVAISYAVFCLTKKPLMPVMVSIGSRV